MKNFYLVLFLSYFFYFRIQELSGPRPWPAAENCYHFHQDLMRYMCTHCHYFISESVIQKRQQEFLNEVKRKLEKELEEELGDDYVLDLKKKYDLPDEYKYDIIPEFWEGHNIFDFITPDIFTVRVFLLTFPMVGKFLF